MWLWQHKNIHKRHLLWAKLFCACLFFHMLFLFWIFCVYHDRSTVTVSLNTKIDYSAPILYVPLGAAKNPTANPSIHFLKQKTLRTSGKENPSNAQPKNSSPLTLTQSTLRSDRVPVSARPECPVRGVSKGNPKPEIKPTPKPAIKTEIKKTEPKPEPIKEIPPVAQITEPVKPTPPPIQAQPLPTAQAQPAIPNNATISHDYREVEALRRAAQLQKELIKNWKAPIGVPKDCACEISITVTPNGTIKDLKMVKNSGVLMYDISARQALFSMTMPQWTHGKTITVNFKQ